MSQDKYTYFFGHNKKSFPGINDTYGFGMNDFTIAPGDILSSSHGTETSESIIGALEKGNPGATFLYKWESSMKIKDV